MIEPARLGWMAAILDIQGHVIQKRNQTRATPQVVIMVESRHRAVIGRLCDMTGTSVELKNNPALPSEWSRRGCIEHCPEAHIHLAEETPMPATSRWTVTGVAAAVTLHSLRPYLVSWTDKYADAYDRVMTNAALAGQGSGATRVAIRRLMGLGWDLPGGWLDDLLQPAQDGNVSDDTATILALSGRKAITA